MTSTLRSVAERLADPVGGLDFMARLVQGYSDDEDNPNVSSYLRLAAEDLRSALVGACESDKYLVPAGNYAIPGSWTVGEAVEFVRRVKEMDA